MACPLRQTKTEPTAKTSTCQSGCATGCAAAPGDDFLRPTMDAAALLCRHVEMLARLKAPRPQRQAA